MRQYMLQVTSTLLFGLDEPELALRLGDMIAEWVLMNDELGAGALVPNETFSKRYEELLAYAEKLEAEILRMIRRRRESNELGRDVLSILVRMHDEEGGLSDEELVGQAAVLFGAAHMTTAHSLCWTLFLLGEHPSVMQRLWDEWQQEGSERPQHAASEMPRRRGLGRCRLERRERRVALAVGSRDQRKHAGAAGVGLLATDQRRGGRARARIACRAAPASCSRRS